MNGKGLERPPRGTNSLLWALFKPSRRTASEKAAPIGEDRAAEWDAAAATKKRPPGGLG